MVKGAIGLAESWNVNVSISFPGFPGGAGCAVVITSYEYYSVISTPVE